MKFYIDKIAEVVATTIIAEVDANLADNAEHFDEDALIWRGLDAAVPDVLNMLPLFDENLRTMIGTHREVRMALDIAKQNVSDFIADAALEDNGTKPINWMHYNGLRQSDFV